MALSFTPPPALAFDPASGLTRALAFVAAALGGFVLMGFLTLHIWPAVLPYSRFLVTQGSGLVLTLCAALLFGVAGLIACVAWCDSAADD